MIRVESVLTCLRWAWDESDGQIFRRFSRALPVEIWLVGMEYPATDDGVVAGAKIQVDGNWRERVLLVEGFYLPPFGETRDQATKIIEACKVFFPQKPPLSLLDELRALSNTQPDPVPIS